MNDSVFLILALVFLAGMIFFSSRKRKKEAEELKSRVVVGAYVMLTSGIYGKILSIEDERMELQTAPNQKLTVALGAVRSIEEEPKKKVAKPAKPATAAKKSTVKPSKPAGEKK